ncbi:tetratricopeptide repeat protein, partial [Coleofasciculus sp. LEGE 07081]
LWKGRWAKNIRWGTVGLASLLMILNLFPLGGTAFSPILSPFQYRPYLGQPFPHSQVIDEIIETSPYLRTTLGVLPSTPEINQHNFNYYGALQDFQVYGRQVGTQQEQLQQDVRSLSWFLTKTGEQGSVPEAQGAMVQTVEQGGDFGLQKSWNLPDGSILKLYHRRELSVEVQLESGVGSQGSGDKIQLDKVTVPDKVPPGVPVPINYEWVGTWEQLQSGIVLLTWTGTPQHRWLHDHGIGMGELHFNSKWVTSRDANTIQNSQFRVVERTAMLPPGDIPAGSYSLEATYLNRETGETYPIQVPPVTVTIDPTATVTPAPELDLLTQLRTLAVNLPKGTDALEPIFEQTGRINQYDPIQDYLVQADLALAHRLRLEPQNLEWAYGLALSRVLQEDAGGAIAALKRVVELDSDNPYARAYLAFVYLYQWRGKNAQDALKPALKLNPNLPELQALSGVAALLQGNVFRAWQIFQALQL